jgi:hydrogenase/urease accessory protein HupE
VIRRWLLPLVGLVLLAAPRAFAHEVRPAFLQIDQMAPTRFEITWKQPTMGDVAIHLAPHLSAGWLDAPPADQYAAEGFLIRKWSVAARPNQLQGQTVGIEGLENTITDVVVRIRLKDGDASQTILRPDSTSYRIPAEERAPANILAFLAAGVQHILTGPDHLLFLLGLLLLVKDRWMLLKTVTAFTAAHSLTLATAVLTAVRLWDPMIDALIALSIIAVGVEALRAHRGGTSLAVRHPWAVAFVFGLLHGLGFASGLTTLGLDHAGLIGALVLFNVGVEVGQLAFVTAALVLIAGVRALPVQWPRPVALAPYYAVGAMGVFWALQCSVQLFSAAP